MDKSTSAPTRRFCLQETIMLNINEFKSELASRDVERPNLYAVTFGTPPAASIGIDVNNKLIQAFADVGESGKLITLFCESANLPGVGFAMDTVRRHGIGPAQKMPISPGFNDVNLSFIADAGGVVYNLFYEWINEIMPYSNPGRPDAVTGGKYDFVMGYKGNYQTDLSIALYRGTPGKFKGAGLLQTALSVVSAAAGTPFIGSLAGSLSSRFAPQFPLEKIRTIKLFKAFPYSISDMGVSSATGDSYSRFTVSFTYYTWSMEKGEFAKAESSSSVFGGLF